MTDEELVRAAVAEAVASVASGGGPFGAVLARGGTIVARGRNDVVPGADPTAHAEVQALRAAGRALGTHVLSGLVLYASSEPCPMCLAAALWARVDRVVYACDREDARAAGFDDAEFWAELARGPAERRLPRAQLCRGEGLAAFAAWTASADRTPY